MLTAQLVRAARSLLEWRQQDLAVKSGISLPAINKLERGAVSPRQFTLDILQKTFEREGVEFIEGPGVRLTDNLFNIETHIGKNAPLQMWRDIIASHQEGGGEALLSGLDESRWSDYQPEITQVLADYQRLGITYRALLCDGDRNFHPGLDVRKHYRWISKALFTQLPYYVYKNKVAFVMWGRPLRVVILTHSIMADTFRRQFEMNWAGGKIPKS